MLECMVAVTESSHLLESTSILYFSLSEEVSLLRNLSDKIYCNLFRIRFNTPYSPIQDLEIINTPSARWWRIPPSRSSCTCSGFLSLLSHTITWSLVSYSAWQHWQHRQHWQFLFLLIFKLYNCDNLRCTQCRINFANFINQELQLIGYKIQMDQKSQL